MGSVSRINFHGPFHRQLLSVVFSRVALLPGKNVFDTTAVVGHVLLLVLRRCCRGRSYGDRGGTVHGAPPDQEERTTHGDMHGVDPLPVGACPGLGYGGGDHRSARPPCGAVVRDDVSSLPFHLLLLLPCSGGWASRDAPRVAYRRPCSSRTRRVLPQPR